MALLPNGRVPGTNGHAGIRALILINLTLTTRGRGRRQPPDQTAHVAGANRRTSDPSLFLDHVLLRGRQARCVHATSSSFQGGGAEQEVT